jgi:hypothetical protein
MAPSGGIMICPCAPQWGHFTSTNESIADLPFYLNCLDYIVTPGRKKSKIRVVLRGIPGTTGFQGEKEKSKYMKCDKTNKAGEKIQIKSTFL